MWLLGRIIVLNNYWKLADPTWRATVVFHFLNNFLSDKHKHYSSYVLFYNVLCWNAWKMMIPNVNAILYQTPKMRQFTAFPWVDLTDEFHSHTPQFECRRLLKTRNVYGGAWWVDKTEFIALFRSTTLRTSHAVGMDKLCLNWIMHCVTRFIGSRYSGDFLWNDKMGW